MTPALSTVQDILYKRFLLQNGSNHLFILLSKRQAIGKVPNGKRASKNKNIPPRNHTNYSAISLLQLIEQMQKLYADDKIDTEEALLKSDIQGLFGLGYAEYTDIVNQVAKQALLRGAPHYYACRQWLR